MKPSLISKNLLPKKSGQHGKWSTKSTDRQTRKIFFMHTHTYTHTRSKKFLSKAWKASKYTKKWKFNFRRRLNLSFQIKEERGNNEPKQLYLRHQHLVAHLPWSCNVVLWNPGWASKMSTKKLSRCFITKNIYLGKKKGLPPRACGHGKPHVHCDLHANMEGYLYKGKIS